MTIRIAEDLLKAVAEKIVRGSEYVLARRLVEGHYDLRLYFVHEQNVPEDLVRAFDGAGARHENLGPGFRLIRVAPHDEPNTAIYKVTIWDKVVFYGFIGLPPEEPPRPSATPASD